MAGPASSSLNTSVYLLGFMGAGKTFVGRALAKEIKVPFTDLDGVIEAKAGQTILEIFQIHGEPYFRLLEAESLLQVSQLPPRVVALGGGTYCFPGNIELANKTGLAVWLDCPFEETAKRCLRMHPPRPLARSETEMRELYELRLPFYRSAPVRVPAGSGRAIPSIVQEIIELLCWKGLLVE